MFGKMRHFAPNDIFELAFIPPQMFHHSSLTKILKDKTTKNTPIKHRYITFIVKVK